VRYLSFYIYREGISPIATNTTMTNTEPTRMIRIKTGREYEVISFPYLPEGEVRVQVINPKTDKPWHAHSFLSKSEFKPIK